MVKQNSNSECGEEKFVDLKELSARQNAFPEIYTIPPQQPSSKKVGQLTEQQLNHFFEKVVSSSYLFKTNYFPLVFRI